MWSWYWSPARRSICPTDVCPARYGSALVTLLVRSLAAADISTNPWELSGRLQNEVRAKVAMPDGAVDGPAWVSSLVSSGHA